MYIIMFVAFYGTAASAESVYHGNVRAELLSDVSGIVPGEPFWVGLKMTMDEGWHTYWRNSGDSGMATDIKWVLPDGFTAGAIRWPYPKRYEYNEGLVGYGYDGTVILLTEILAASDISEGQEVFIQAKAKWLSCEKICVPGKADLMIGLIGRNTAQINDELSKRFIKERERWPIEKSHWSISVEELEDAYLVRADTVQPQQYLMTALNFFPYRNDVVDHAQRQMFNTTQSGYELTVPKSEFLMDNLVALEGVLVSDEGWLDQGRGHSLSMNILINKKKERP